jgi:hypothetical protein
MNFEENKYILEDIKYKLSTLRFKNKDFEDSIQIYCASTVKKMDAIVTRNKKDYKASEIPAYNPDEILSRI